MDISVDTSKIAKELGKIGGDTTLKKYGTEHYRRMRKLSGEAKKRKAQNS